MELAYLEDFQLSFFFLMFFSLLEESDVFLKKNKGSEYYLFIYPFILYFYIIFIFYLLKYTFIIFSICLFFQLSGIHGLSFKIV